MKKVTIADVTTMILGRMDELRDIVNSGIAGDFSKGEYAALEHLMIKIDKMVNE